VGYGPWLKQVPEFAAQEATANGIAWTYSPMVDIARDPRWGRIAKALERILMCKDHRLPKLRG